MIRVTPRLSVLLLCSAMLAGCATAPATTADKLGLTKPADSASAEIAKNPPKDLDGGVRQAQLYRLAGDYDSAVHVLSQLMLVAADDPRVVAEYGKTLAQQGRAQDALPFLTRAVELQPDNWSVYSAMGVAYDQLGDQTAARNAYEHALSLRPGDPGVLNNYALSRMVANDPDGAAALMEKARIAGGADNAQIARNMKMVAALIPQKAAATPAPQALAYSVKHAAPVAMANAAPQARPFVSLPQSAPMVAPQGAPRPLISQGAPRPLMPQVSQAMPMQVAPQQAAPQPRIVVMQRVPDDPLAGPYAPQQHKVATKVKAAHVAKAEPKTDAQPASKPEQKAATVVAPPLPPLPGDKAPAAKGAAKVAAAKPAPAAAAKPASIKTATGDHAELAIKAADVKPVSKSVPQLRMAAGIY